MANGSALYAAAALVACVSGIAQAERCDLDAPRFDPSLATIATSNPGTTRVPRTIAVELAGFATRADAAKCFGHRYHEQRRAEF